MLPDEIKARFLFTRCGLAHFSIKNFSLLLYLGLQSNLNKFFFWILLFQTFWWAEKRGRLSQQWACISCCRRIFGHSSTFRPTRYGWLRSSRQVEHSHISIAVLSGLWSTRWVSSSASRVLTSVNVCALNAILSSQDQAINFMPLIAISRRCEMYKKTFYVTLAKR